MAHRYKSLVRLLLPLLLLLCAGVGYGYYRVFRSSNYLDSSSDAVILYIYPNESWEEITKKTDALLSPKFPKDLGYLSRLLSQKGSAKAGAYRIRPNTSTYQLYEKLQRGQEDPIKVTFNTLRHPKDFARLLSSQMMVDSLEVLSCLEDKKLIEELGIQDSTLFFHLIPNTYEFYWSSPAPNILKRLVGEYKRFWNTTRIEKAKKIELTPYEVSTLAAIVQEESSKVEEYPDIAGLYLNRLRKGMLLQADPTVKYALGDFALRRILFEHLKVDSPYNTYKYKGLPPSPIRLPSIQAIDGVLNAKEHPYLYMCAKEDFSGKHNFASTYSEHLKNARKYSIALNQRGIK